MEEENKMVKELIRFRVLMGVSLSKEDVKSIWGKSFLKEIGDDTKFQNRENKFVNLKLEYARKNLKILKIFNWVKFVGVSGSVGAGFAKEQDDIDVFIVVQNYTAWIYRGLISLRNIFHNRIRTKRHKDIKDKFCINLISEERDLMFESDMFNFHELMFLKPIFNEQYLNFIYSKNKWLRSGFFVKRELLFTKIRQGRKVGFLLQFLNWMFFVLQIFFMIVSNHKPDVARIRRNYKGGKIEFFESDFKQKKIKEYLKSV